MTLVGIKEAVPVKVAEYAKAKKIDTEPAFAWWVPYTLKKRNHIISAVNRHVKMTHTKYGIRVPKTRREALAIDQEIGNNVWSDAIKKEMQNVAPAFKLKAYDKCIGNKYKYVGFHMVYDIKMEESVHIALTYAALMELDIMAANIGNTYLQAPTSSKYYTKLGPEFGPEYKGRLSFVVRAAYSLKETGSDFRNHLQDFMCHLGYTSKMQTTTSCFAKLPERTQMNTMRWSSYMWTTA